MKHPHSHMDSAVIHITEIDCEVGDWWNCLRVMCIWQVAVLAMLNLHISLASSWEIWGSDSGMAENWGLLGCDSVVGWAVPRIPEECSACKQSGIIHLMLHSITFQKT